MTEDERTERAILFHQELALRQHQQNHLMTGETLSECTQCGNEIPLERQRALPGVRLCVECKRIEECEVRLYL